MKEKKYSLENLSLLFEEDYPSAWIIKLPCSDWHQQDLAKVRLCHALLYRSGSLPRESCDSSFSSVNSLFS